MEKRQGVGNLKGALGRGNQSQDLGFAAGN